MHKTTIEMTCDLPNHRRKLDANEDVESYSFSLNGSAYEIDLCPQHRKAFEEKLGLFERFGRKVRRGKGRPTRTRTKNHRARTSEIRGWAREHGYELADRGRIPMDVVSAYEAAH
jgi:Lsr2